MASVCNGKKCLMTLILITTLITISVKADVFTSMADIEALLNAEDGAASFVERYLKTEYSRLNALKSYAKEHVSHHEQMRANNTVLAEPLNLFLSIKRLYYMQVLMKRNNADDYLQKISQHRQQSRGGLPTEDDSIGAALALFRLQDAYKLEAKDLADGLIGGVRSSRPLTALECYELGKVAYDLDESDFYHTLLWMQEADRRLSTEKKPSVKRQDILDYLSYAMFEQENVEHALILTKQLKRLDPSRSLVNENIEYYETHLKQNNVDTKSLNEANLPRLKLKRDLSMKPPWFQQYEALCRGEKSLSRKMRSKLTCYYKQNRPFLKLARIKVEVMHLRPKIVLLKDVVSDDESLAIQKIAGPNFVRAAVVKGSGKFEASDKRTSKISWMQDKEYEVARTLSKRVEDMTDLTCDTAEFLQVANYGIGGHYEAHFDFTPEDALPGELKTFDEWGQGNRIATILFYLTQPSAGGGTVFPDLNLTLNASKNDAVFWHNLLKSGKGDTNLRHAACPVLSGVKWVGNKWLHERGQEFLRPCGLDKNEYE